MKIKNSIVLVTGANRGLGKALVERALELGAAKVYAAARNPQTVSKDPRVVPLKLEVTSMRDIDAAAAKARDVTVLINNAGVATSADIFAANPNDIQRDLDVNFFGPLAMIRAFRGSLEKNHAAVVNVLSIASLASFPVLSGYSASKAAAHSLTQAARALIQGITVHGAYAGPIDTDMGKALDVPKATAAEVAKNILQGVEAGDEEIYPDGMAGQVGAAYTSSPKAVERQFAGR